MTLTSYTEYSALQSLFINKGMYKTVITCTVGVDKDIEQQMNSEFESSLSLANDFRVASVHIADTDDEVTEILTSLMYSTDCNLSDIECFRGIIYPAETFPVEAPFNDYDFVFLFNSIDEDNTAIAEFYSYDSELIQDYIEGKYQETSLSLDQNSEFDIDQWFIFIGKTVSFTMHTTD